MRTTTDMVSIPVGMCSISTPWRQSTSSTFTVKPSVSFIWSFSITMEEKPFRPAMPVTGRLSRVDTRG